MKPLALLNGALAAAVLLSALGVVYLKHQTRRVFAESQELMREEDRLNVEWNMLQLEREAQATYGRVEQVARERLNMRIPRRDDVIILKY